MNSKKTIFSLIMGGVLLLPNIGMSKSKSTSRSKTKSYKSYKPKKRTTTTSSYTKKKESAAEKARRLDREKKKKAADAARRKKEAEARAKRDAERKKKAAAAEKKRKEAQKRKAAAAKKRQTPKTKKLGKKNMTIKETKVIKKKDRKGNTVEIRKTKITSPNGREYNFNTRRDITDRHYERTNHISSRYEQSRIDRGMDPFYNPAAMMMIGMYSDSPLVCALTGMSGYCFMGMMLNNNDTHYHSHNQGYQGNPGYNTVPQGQPVQSQPVQGRNFIDDAPPEVIDQTTDMITECIIEGDSDEVRGIVDCLNNYIDPQAKLTVKAYCEEDTLADLRELVGDNLVLSDGGCDSYYNQQQIKAESALQNYTKQTKEVEDDFWY